MIRKIFSKFYSFNYGLGVIAGGLILLSSIFITYEVIMRYLFNNAPSWTNDLTRYFLLAVAFLPVAFTLQQKAHISVDILVLRVKGKVKKLLTLLSYISVIIYSSIVFWKTTDFFQKAFKANWKTMGTFTIPASWLYALILVGSTLLFIAAMIRIVETILDKDFMSQEQKELMSENVESIEQTLEDIKKEKKAF